MMKTIEQQAEVRRLQLSLQEYSCTGTDAEVAGSIRQLDGVINVLTNPDQHAIEIAFRHPIDGLLSQIDNALKSYRCKITAGRVF